MTMEQSKMTNESCLQTLNNFILNATAKGVDIVNSLESVDFFMNKAIAYEELQKENERLRNFIEEKNIN